MRHYFIDRKREKDEFFQFKEEFLDNSYVFHSSNDMFSKNSLDEGSKTLVETIVNNYEELKGKVLDFACGYGAIGVTLKNHYPKTFITMSDINRTAIALAKKNIIENHGKEEKAESFNVVRSNLFDKIEDKFNYIITNPPIKTGKTLLFNIITQSKEYLEDGGEIVLVIRKDHGEESLRKHMLSVFGNSEIVNRNKGYYILRSKKDN